MAEWDALPKDILVLIGKQIYFYEDLFNFYTVCKSWCSVKSELRKSLPFPSRYPWVMLTDKAEINYPKLNKDMDASDMLKGEVRKNEQIEGMENRQFFSFLTSKVYEVELPEVIRRKCLGVGYGLLLTLGYDTKINILNPFTRQLITMPSMFSFKTNYVYCEELEPSEVFSFFIQKVAMSSNPYSPSNRDCVIMAIYGEFSTLAFARPGDQVWTDVSIPRTATGAYPFYMDVVYYNGKFYVVDRKGIICVCDINDANEPKATPIACIPYYPRSYTANNFLVESSGDLLLVVRIRKNGLYLCGEYRGKVNYDQPVYNHTVGFHIFKLEECDGDSSHNYPYKLTEAKSLGNNALFIGNNASVSVPCSKFVKANSIYFSDNEVLDNSGQPCGGGYDTGIYDVESGNITLHYASKFMSHLTPPTWIVM